MSLSRSLSPAMLTSLAQSLSSMSTLVYAYVLMQFVGTQAFGQFSTLQLLVTFGLLLQTALVQSPLLLLQAKNQQASDAISARHAVLVFGAFIAPIAALITLISLWTCGWSNTDSMLASVLVGLQIRRPLQRFYLQNQQHFLLVATADVRSSLLGCLLVGGGYLADSLSLTWVMGSICVAMMTFRYKITTFRQFRADSEFLPQLKLSYSAQGKPALKGALVSELMSNGHSYWIAVCLGSEALAPFSAAALVFRPAAVLAQSLLQASRATVSRFIQQPHSTNDLQNLLRPLQRQLRHAYLADLIPALFCLVMWPTLLWPHGYTFEFCAAFLMAALLAALRLYRQVPILVLQAYDQFELLYRLQREPALYFGVAAFASVFISPLLSMACIVLAETMVAWRLAQFYLAYQRRELSS